MPIRDATVSEGTMCPFKTIGRPGLFMSHICVDITCFLSGKLIVRDFFAMCLLTMSMLSITKIDVTPVSAIAWFVAITIAFKYCVVGLPNICLAIAMSNGRAWRLVVCAEMRLVLDTLEVTTMTSLLSLPASDLIKVGSKEWVDAETKHLHLFAVYSVFSAPHRQLFWPDGSRYHLVHSLRAWVIPCHNELLRILAHKRGLMIHLLERAHEGCVPILYVKPTQKTNVPCVVSLVDVQVGRVALLLEHVPGRGSSTLLPRFACNPWMDYNLVLLVPILYLDCHLLPIVPN